jgi:ribosomal protein L14E/L6E/L27E
MKRTGEDRYQPGMLAYSLRGRDAGRVYVIIRREEQFVIAADGKRRPLSCPKRKNIRHLQLINRSIDLEKADDTIIIQAIEEYLNRLHKQED